MDPDTAVNLNARFTKGEISAKEIVTSSLHRIEEQNKKLGAFLTLFPEKALKKADELDSKRSKGESLGKLAAVPIAVKDNIHIQGELTTCASKFLVNYKAPFNATVTERLLAEDAIIIGKTNLDEFAMGSSTENSALQKTYNPWNLKCTPGGSSGGSAAAVAARLCPLSLGSDTGGSIRQPASYCGIVGFKPTYGRISRFGLVAFGSSLDQIGPFGTTVEDVSLVLDILGQPCKKDSTSIQSPLEPCLGNLDTNIKHLKIGVPRRFLEDLHSDAKQNFEATLKAYESMGAQLVDIDLDILKYSIATYYILATAEASTNLARFDGVRYGVRSKDAKSLDEVYELSKEEGFGAEVKRRILLGTYVLSAGYQDAYYRKAQRVRALMIQHFQTAFKKCNVVAMPTAPSTAFELGSIQDPLQMYLADIYTIPANLAGLPAINIPSGFDTAGMPFGFQLLAPQKGDRFLLQVAHAFQKETDFHLKVPGSAL